MAFQIDALPKDFNIQYQPTEAWYNLINSTDSESCRDRFAYLGTRKLYSILNSKGIQSLTTVNSSEFTHYNISLQYHGSEDDVQCTKPVIIWIIISVVAWGLWIVSCFIWICFCENDTNQYKYQPLDRTASEIEFGEWAD